MTFAVVGILGHFSKTTLLFFIPQVFNFVYSVPQLFHLIPCPRHRMPKFNSKIDKLEVSKTSFKYNELHIVGKTIYHLFKFLRIIQVQETKDNVIYINNLTLINFVLMLTGPMHEAKLTTVLLFLQIICSCIAFIVRYPLASFVYDV